jgi:Tol biopolymer transport system component
VFVHDRQTGTTERVSVNSAGAQANYGGAFPSISVDGRFVAFDSYASNLVSGDTNGAPDVFVHDRQTGTTERVSVNVAGTQGNNSSGDASISADGRLVAFDSYASNLVSGDTNGTWDVFVRDRQAGTTKCMSVDSAGTQGNDSSLSGSISVDGRFVAFQSSASKLVSGDTNGASDVFVHDRQTGTTERVSVDSAGREGNLDSVYPAISADGRFVAFHGDASNLVPGDTNGSVDVFVHGSYLTLEADPPSPSAHVTITFSTWTGDANGLSLLVMIDLNGSSTFLPLVLASFDATGLWTLSGTVPSGLSGNIITFETFGIVPTGKVDVSNPFAVAFQ